MSNENMHREWERRLTAYRIAAALSEADASFGRFARENETFNVARRQHRHRSVNHAKSESDGVSWEEAWCRMGLAEKARLETFLEPMWEAARCLAKTSAPTLEATLIKVEIIKHEELDNDSEMGCDPFELVAEDFARIGREVQQ